MGENNLVKNFRIIQQGNEPYEQGTLSLYIGSDLDGNIQNLMYEMIIHQIQKPRARIHQRYSGGFVDS